MSKIDERVREAIDELLDGNYILRDFRPSESYDQIIACIEAKGWRKFIGDGPDGITHATIATARGRFVENNKSGPLALCEAFLAACESEVEGV